MVARALIGTGFILVVGAAIAAAQAPAPQPLGRAHASLSMAVEAQRRGDYDAAASLLQEVSANTTALTQVEQQELVHLLKDNAAALDARRTASRQLRDAVSALHDKRQTDAVDLLKRVAVNEQYLNAADRQTFRQCSAGMNLPTAAPAAAADPAGQARHLVRQARAQFIQSDFDAADKMARDAAALHVAFAKDEDSPAKVLDDVTKARGDANALLKASRAALTRKDYDKAEQYAQMSEKASSTWSLTFFGDTPSKALKDIKDARTAVHAAPASPTRAGKEGKADAPKQPVVQSSNKQDAGPGVVQASTPSATPQPASKNTDAARALLAQARKAIDAGDLPKARQLIEQARALKPELQWYEDRPDQLLAEVAHAETHQKAQAVAVKDKDKDKSLTPAEAKTKAGELMKLGRTQLNDNKLDDAVQTVAKLRAMPGLSWGLFEDSPEKLRQDVDAARKKHDTEESVKLLDEARRLMKQGAFEDAQRAALRAQALHGPYSVWDFGDRPDKVLADLGTARLNAKAAPNPTAVAKSGDHATTGDHVITADHAATADHATTGDKHPATPPAPQEKITQVAVNPPAVAPDVVSHPAPEKKPAPPPAPAPSTAATKPAAPTVTDPNRAKADQLLAECGRLERDNKLLEARQKAMEAVQLKATFGAKEESPEYAVTQCAFLATREIKRLMVHATETIQYTDGDPLQRCALAEQDLLKARELAAGFGLDGQPIEVKLTWVRQNRAVVLKQPVPDAPAPTVQANATPTPLDEGKKKLDMARQELNRGSTGTARKIAEEVFAGPIYLRDEAGSLLRSIDAEEFAQQCRQDQKTFDAANSAYTRGDFAHAMHLLLAIDARHLDEVRASRMRNIMADPGMQSSQVQLASTGHEGVGAHETTPTPQPTLVHPPDDAGHSHATDDAGSNLLKTTEAMRQVKFQQLRNDGLDVQRKAQEKASVGQTAVAIDLLQQYLAQVDKEELDAQLTDKLRRPVESRLKKFQILKLEEDVNAASAGNKDAINKERQAKFTAEQNKEKNVADLMKQFNDYFKEGKYAEAMHAADMAHELDPDNPATTAALGMAKIQKNRQYYDKLKDQRGDYALQVLDDTGNFGPAATGDQPLVIDKDTELRNQKRTPGTYPEVKTDKEREIEHQLTLPVTLNFTDMPLGKVLDDLRGWNHVNIYVDQSALNAKGISLEQPVSVKLENISLKSALHLVLKDVGATYIIKDECLQVTTTEQAKGKMERVTYQVGDLVIPVPNSASVVPTVSTGPAQQNMPPYVPTPVTGPYAVGTGTPTGTPTGSPFAADQGARTQAPTNPMTHEEELKKLITNTIEPRSWSDMGGPGTIDYHPLTMGLVVNQTPDIQEQIVDLLNSLRRLQDQEVALEVRFISISDDFFERIGVDFAVNIKTDQETKPFQPALVSGQFQQPGYINDFNPSRLITGVAGPGGTLTNDLGIPIRPNTFINTVPPYGGYVPGFTLGLAFLSEIQVFLFMEAVQGDQRVNVMQAPRLTAFNGQTATLNVADSQSFVTNVQVQIAPNGNPVFTPIITNSGSTVSLTLQPVISADRRFVRLNFGNPFSGGGGGGGVTLTNLVPGTVAVFPVVVPVFSQSTIQDPTAQVVFTQLIQQPVTNIINIDTTVSVPDGGTVVMGGLKRLSESRSEYGPPILSKIPYINRLFKNVGYGRSAESLLIMVTPRIIIQEEEEERQTGFHLGTAVTTP
jgi:type II secretory pathway component GspD/PulD (secretin)